MISFLSPVPKSQMRNAHREDRQVQVPTDGEDARPVTSYPEWRSRKRPGPAPEGPVGEQARLRGGRNGLHHYFSAQVRISSKKLRIFVATRASTIQH